MCLGIGVRGRCEVSLEGCIANQDVVIGRGRLPAVQYSLRLEYTDQQVRALCSADGSQWYAVGAVVFPQVTTLQVGIYAIGSIDRTIYHGAFPQGTALRVSSLKLWTGIS